MREKKGASLVFDKKKKWPHLGFCGGNKKKMPAVICFFLKKWPEKHLFFFSALFKYNMFAPIIL